MVWLIFTGYTNINKRPFSSGDNKKGFIVRTPINTCLFSHLGVQTANLYRPNLKFLCWKRIYSSV